MPDKSNRVFESALLNNPYLKEIQQPAGRQTPKGTPAKYPKTNTSEQRALVTKLIEFFKEYE